MAAVHRRALPGGIAGGIITAAAATYHYFTTSPAPTVPPTHSSAPIFIDEGFCLPLNGTNVDISQCFIPPHFEEPSDFTKSICDGLTDFAILALLALLFIIFYTATNIILLQLDNTIKHALPSKTRTVIGNIYNTYTATNAILLQLGNTVKQALPSKLRTVIGNTYHTYATFAPWSSLFIQVTSPTPALTVCIHLTVAFISLLVTVRHIYFRPESELPFFDTIEYHHNKVRQMVRAGDSLKHLYRASIAKINELEIQIVASSTVFQQEIDDLKDQIAKLRQAAAKKQPIFTTMMTQPATTSSHHQSKFNSIPVFNFSDTANPFAPLNAQTANNATAAASETATTPSTAVSTASSSAPFDSAVNDDAAPRDQSPPAPAATAVSATMTPAMAPKAVPYKPKNAETGEEHLCKRGALCRGNPDEYDEKGWFLASLSEVRSERYGPTGGSRTKKKNLQSAARGKQLCCDCFVEAARLKKETGVSPDWFHGQ